MRVFVGDTLNREWFNLLLKNNASKRSEGATSKGIHFAGLVITKMRWKSIYQSVPDEAARYY